jgi:hypothetical protein
VKEVSSQHAWANKIIFDVQEVQNKKGEPQSPPFFYQINKPDPINGVCNIHLERNKCLLECLADSLELHPKPLHSHPLKKLSTVVPPN